MLAAGCAVSDIRRSDYFAELGPVAYSADGRELAVGRRVFNTVYFFDAADLRLKRTLPGNEETANRDAKLARILAFSPAGGWIAMAMNDGSLVVREAASGREAFRSRTVQGLSAAAFSPKGDYLVAAGSGNDALLWSFPEGREVGVLSGHTGPVISLAFSPDGLLIASGSEDRTVRIWGTATQSQVGLLEGHDYPVHSVAFSPDASMLVAYAGTVRVWNLAEGKALTQVLANVDTSMLEGLLVITNILGNASSMNLVGAPIYPPPVGVSTAPQGRLNPVGRAVYGRLPARFSPDGNRLAVMRLNPGWAGDLEVSLVDLAKKEPVIRVPCQGSYPCGGMAFSPDGRLMAISVMGIVQIWDVSSGKEVASNRGPFPLEGRPP